MKTKMVIGLVIIALFALNTFAGQDEFSKGEWFLTPQVALYSYDYGSTTFGASIEYAITDNIGIGGTVMMAFWTYYELTASLITPSFDVAYHFTRLNVKKLDLYLGASLGYSIFSIDTPSWSGSDSSEFYIGPFVGARYYLNQRRTIALNLRLNGTLAGTYTGVGGLLGVTFKL